MDPTAAAALHKLGALTPEEMVAFALSKLELSNSITLAQLAGETSPSHSARDPLFRASLEEMGIGVLSTEDACIIAAKYFAQLVLDDELTPYQGAARIWQHCADSALGSVPGSPMETVWNKLGKFVGLAVEVEEENRPRKQLELEILEQCRLLLNG